MTWLQARVSWQQVTKPGNGTPLSGGALHLMRPPGQEAEASRSLPGVRLQRCEQAVEKGEGARLGMACTHAEGSERRRPIRAPAEPACTSAAAACLQPACTRLHRRPGARLRGRVQAGAARGEEGGAAHRGGPPGSWRACLQSAAGPPQRPPRHQGHLHRPATKGSRHRSTAPPTSTGWLANRGLGHSGVRDGQTNRAVAGGVRRAVLGGRGGVLTCVDLRQALDGGPHRHLGVRHQARLEGHLGTTATGTPLRRRQEAATPSRYLSSSIRAAGWGPAPPAFSTFARPHGGSKGGQRAQAISGRDTSPARQKLAVTLLPVNVLAAKSAFPSSSESLPLVCSSCICCRAAAFPRGPAVAYLSAGEEEVQAGQRGVDRREGHVAEGQTGTNKGAAAAAGGAAPAGQSGHCQAQGSVDHGLLQHSQRGREGQPRGDARRGEENRKMGDSQQCQEAVQPSTAGACDSPSWVASAGGSATPAGCCW
jgi:hypothetical protein